RSLLMCMDAPCLRLVLGGKRRLRVDDASVREIDRRAKPGLQRRPRIALAPHSIPKPWKVNMSSKKLDGLPDGSSQILTHDLLGRLHDLNLDFLELLIAGRATGAVGMHFLPERIIDALASCSLEARHALRSDE